jgi:hypothetical protein
MAEEHKGHADLQAAFRSFTGGAADMDGRSYVKCFRDTKILGAGLTTTDIDLTFAKVKDRTARKITYAQFQASLVHIAAKKN